VREEAEQEDSKQSIIATLETETEAEARSLLGRIRGFFRLR
jgi:hypothetical protein